MNFTHDAERYEPLGFLRQIFPVSSSPGESGRVDFQRVREQTSRAGIEATRSTRLVSVSLLCVRAMC